jgi:hypothetical protein
MFGGRLHGVTTSFITPTGADLRRGGFMDGTCEWTEEKEWGESMGTWDTECGNAFTIIDGTPQENGFKFCLYCGKSLIESAEGTEQANQPDS